MAQLQKLSMMKKQGGGRNSPVEEASPFRCPQCNFKSVREGELQQHMKNKHCILTSCPFCLIGFYNQDVLRKHIDEQHSENRQIVRETREPVTQSRKPESRGICIFFLQSRCKKGNTCDFSHVNGEQ